MSFEIRITRTFCASHQIRMYDGELEPLHGHNWQVTVTIGSEKLDQVGFVTDFHLLEQQLDQVLKQLDNKHLNEVVLLKEINPSAENVAWVIGQNLKIPSPAKLISVEITEAPGCVAVWRKD